MNIKIKFHVINSKSSVLRNDDLKEMLESSKESLKLEAMKRIVGLIAKGKNASELFPAVVKNVASKNIEDPNQFIRASALRVLSSIRVPIIVPIMMLAIKEAAADLSPYVRKTSAHAIQKLYSLDPEQKEQLIEVIEKLLKDKSTLVAGSVVMAFEEVCPDRIDLIHKNYRKLCNLLVDVEEWGQVVIISMLTRYARTQFISPWKEDAVFDGNNEKTFYESDSEEKKDQTENKPYIMDPDHRLLLRNTKPLLQSRNTAVVMSVAQLYWHLAPKHEVSIVTKSLVRLLRSHREVQYIVLQNIATMSIQRKGMFEPFMKSFYVRSTDATHIKTLKVTPTIYIHSLHQDKAFAAATIQAIGRCATNISEVTDTCLNGLVLLLSNRDETVVAESVVVIKKLLQTQPTQHSEIIKHMAKLFDNITVPMARASILWLMGEYCERVPKIAPDVLRKMAKTFTAEEDIVKLQTVNLAAKLYLINSKQTKLLTQYILNLGKYDQNYDIRDRTRFIRQLIVPNEKSGALNKYARRILLAPKPAPVLESSFKDRDRYQLGTLSHSLNIKASGYQELCDWPAVAPDQSVRNVEVIDPERNLCKQEFFSVLNMYMNVCSESGSESEDSSEDSEETSSDSGKSSSGSEESSSESESEQKKKKKKMKKMALQKKSKPTAADRYSEIPPPFLVVSCPHIGPLRDASPRSDNQRVYFISTQLLQKIKSRLIKSTLPSRVSCLVQVTTPSFGPVKTYELLHHMTGKGLSAKYHFPRQPCLYQPSMVAVQVILTNSSDHSLEEIHIGDRNPASLNIHCFNTIGEYSTSGSSFLFYQAAAEYKELLYLTHTNTDQFSVSIQPAVGELLMPSTMAEQDFIKEQGKLQGMNETSQTVTMATANTSSQAISKQVLSVANVGVVSSSQSNFHRFAGRTVSSGALVLVTLEMKESSSAQLTINTEKSVMASMLLRDLKQALAQV
uniref:AP-3 complex subunit beta n=1 Tax=Echeneis naucrates TaxID=173247 RepID=A0A665TD46_ECHNA